MADVFDLLVKENPILAKVGSDPFSIAKFVANLDWVLKCDREFFYQGSKIITHNNQSLAVEPFLLDVCRILNDAALDLAKVGQPDLFSDSFLNKVKFEVSGGSIVTEVRGVRDVPSLFPVKALVYKIDEQKELDSKYEIPRDVAMAMYTDNLLKSISQYNTSSSHVFTQDDLSSALAGLSKHVAKPQPTIAGNTFAARLELERQNKVQQGVAAA